MSGVFAVLVTIDVRPEALAEFEVGLRANAAATRAEPGCLRFDVLRERDEPNRFVLYELYTNEDAFFTGHRGAAQYPAWTTLCERCVVPDGRRNTYAVPAFDEEMHDG
ncbi:putative quinol monooxygenase [Microbacterium horticulturae]|uniref:Quinol monooxygenase n=1 Tax=Microbacterium horticulturae TaxID=3028316 RepID=A0ABY8BYU1_9MICO|nr:putative quinol monooxygenase [Microbacterium sp. KACC 23027]WEG08011.1 putative quinol monooxygenase [Microbacterium sp. KACC 23027]